MRGILFIDTETSDLPDYHSGPGRHQPHIVQLAAVLVEGRNEETLAMLIQPEGWTIRPEAQAKHGISMQRARSEGIPISKAIDAFNLLLVRSELAVAHNVRFDQLVIDSEYLRLGRRAEWPRMFCTMVRCTDLLKLPGRLGYKWPSLEETYRHFFGREHVRAHDALADVQACRAIYQELVNRGLA